MFHSFSALAEDQVSVQGLFGDKVAISVNGKRKVLSPTPPPYPQQSDEILLISSDSEGALLLINGEERYLELGSEISSHYVTAQKQKVQIWQGQDGMYRTPGRINQRPVNFLVDTGASTVAMSRLLAQQLGIDYRRLGKAVKSETASGVVEGYYLKLDRIDIGGITLYQVDAVVLDSDMPSDPLLGLSFLGQLEINHSSMMMELSK
ncbi:MAG: retroviral-like aspartic protease family protein [Gammaproteobacteria bacterium]|nr:retroviral-like aspartic protease family protein [Gammaproteobacteria bacterium]